MNHCHFHDEIMAKIIKEHPPELFAKSYFVIHATVSDIAK
jgi:hypothetical protein